ncbi:MAG: GSCFA domain-containing protein [Bacteroidales bacterium]|nr:GSCFA domain-containing protein [Bacteroidales bacterium]
MQFQTPVSIIPSPTPIDYSEKLMLFGSCFAENMGEKLTNYKFQVDINPFGILYNPLSVKSAVMDLINQRVFSESDLFENQGTYHSFSHHSRFSSVNIQDCLGQINDRMVSSSNWLRETDRIIFTFGTAFIYFLQESGAVVSNCHKLPEKTFKRERISVEKIVSEWKTLIDTLREINSNIQILFTVSPIRHWKDGAHENQLSKATLLLAIHQLMIEFDCCCYFPAYEIVMDELRDYRFYAEDMIHPSNQTIDYIWSRFAETQISKESNQLMTEWQTVQKGLAHRPYNPKSETYKHFLEQNLQKLKQLSKKSPYFAVSAEINQLHEQLKSFE